MESVHKQPLLQHIKSHITYYFVVYMVVPGVFIFQMTVVYPNLVMWFEAGIARQCMHLCIITFYFINVIGNMILSIFMESSLKEPVVGEGGTYCELCRMMRPARSWHCKKCNICVLKRDHHCNFLARCIGLYNQRYFILFLGHVMISMTYMTYYNYYFATLNYIGHYDWHEAKSLPPPKIIKLYVFLILLIIIISSILFFSHLWHAALGVTCYEFRFPELRKASKWKQNLLNIFGTKWYLAIVWPLCDSPIPNDDKDS